ncbi:hypothetical protein HC928_11170 [bacterium]|nr:hypothetical protein [bacterium]
MADVAAWGKRMSPIGDILVSPPLPHRDGESYPEISPSEIPPSFIFMTHFVPGRVGEGGNTFCYIFQTKNYTLQT